MKIAIGCDHIVTHAKNYLIGYLTKKGHKLIDCGTYDDTRTHYDIYGFEVARQVVTKHADIGIVICGTGVGITNAAQKTKGTRVCLTRDVEVARKSRELYNCNILGMGGNIVGIGLMEAIIDAFIGAKYKGGNKAIIKTIDARIVKPNYDIHQFDIAIRNWEKGMYTNGVKQAKVPLPKT
jgi:galactose-6-phosphate isomerase